MIVDQGDRMEEKGRTGPITPPGPHGPLCTERIMAAAQIGLSPSCNAKNNNNQNDRGR